MDEGIKRTMDDDIRTPQTPIKAILIDLSGTLHISETPIRGAIEACKRLASRSDIRVKFLTNTTTLSSASLLTQLRRMGFDEEAIPPDIIMTSTNAARELLIKRNLRPMCLVEDDLMADLQGVETEDPNCVLIGLAPSAFHYHRLNLAFRLLIKLKHTKHNPLIAIHRANYVRVGDGELSLGPGAFISGLEAAAGVKAEVVGKPNAAFFEAALSDLKKSPGFSPQHVIMIGDDIHGDIGGALAAGLGGAILVRTGKYCTGDETRTEYRPTFTADSIAEAVDYIFDELL